MTINTEDLLNSILESVGRIDYIHPVDIPNIDLYMDQVTTFMEEQLSSTKRYEDDKILTKTMRKTICFRLRTRKSIPKSTFWF